MVMFSPSSPQPETPVPLLPRVVAWVRALRPGLLLVLALWGLFVLWTAIGLFSSIGTVMRGLSASPDDYYLTYRGPAELALNFWALAAAIGLAFMVANPFRWGNGKRLALGCTAFAMMLGFIAGNGVSSLLAGFTQNGFLLFLVTPFALAIGGLIMIFVLLFAATVLFGLFVAVPVTMFNQLLSFDNAVTRYNYKAGGLSRYIVRAVYWLRNEPMPASPPDDSKGARLATQAEIQALHKPNSLRAMAFGHIGAPLMLSTDKHILIMASTRSGKGVTLIIPHLLRYWGSAFVLDPKGENARATGRQRAELNDEVHYLDPFGISGKPQSRFNPLARFTPDNMEAESKALASALFIVDDRHRDHWTAAGQQLLAAIILYVYCSPDIPPGKKDLPTVRRLLLGNIDPTLDAMILMDDADGLLRDLAMSFINTPEKERGSIVSTAQRETEILDNPKMIACLSAEGPGKEVDFAVWHRGTMSVFLCLSAPKFPTFNRWLRLVLTSALDEMTDTLDPPKLPVCFMLDELATLGHLATVENAVGLAAGYGIQLVNVFQDVAQMRDLYKGRWASFIGNAGVRALFSLDDYDTAEYWSKFIGGRLVEGTNRQQDQYGLSNSSSVSESMRPLMSPDQLMMDFSSKKMLVLAQGAHPIITDRTSYFRDESLAGLWDDPRLPLTPKSPPSPATSSPPPTPADIFPEDEDEGEDPIARAWEEAFTAPLPEVD